LLQYTGVRYRGEKEPIWTAHLCVCYESPATDVLNLFFFN